MTTPISSPAQSWVVEAWSPGFGSPDADHAPAPASVDSAVPSDFIIRTMTQLLQTQDAAEACRLLANCLQQFLGCRQVAVGLSDRRGKRCRLRGLSGVVRFDSHAGYVGALQDAMEEAVVRGCRTAWPPEDDSQKHAALAHQQLIATVGAECVVSVPIRDGHDLVVGIIQFIDESATSAQELIGHYALPLAAVLGRLQRDQRGVIARTWQWLSHGVASRRGRAIALVSFAAVGLLAVPFPHRVHCDCLVQPVTRRFVVAPYDGTLEKCLVSPGDVVRRGDVLARLDEREIRWELAGLTADCARAEKERDAAMAGHKTSGAQLAELEMRRMQLQMQLLEHRLENLAVRSPIDGIVVAGDLEKAEGAPLTIGQSLFEIAPLDRMVCEVSVPEKEIAHVQAGMPALVHLDACPGQTIEGALQEIHPQAELHNEQSVFVADMELVNPQGLLRPGMNGSAKVTSGRRSLGWILFHEPWSRVRRAVAW